MDTGCTVGRWFRPSSAPANKLCWWALAAAASAAALGVACGGRPDASSPPSPAPAATETVRSETAPAPTTPGRSAPASPRPEAGAFDLASAPAGLREEAIRYLAEEETAAVIPLAGVARPAPGTPVSLVEFRTVVRRVTTTPRGNHEYSQLQAFAPGNTHVLLIEGEGEDEAGIVVRRWPSLDLVLGEAATASWNAPRWHPSEPGTVVHFDSNADETLRLQLTRVEAARTETVFTFPPSYRRLAVNPSFEEISRTGRWLAGLADTSSGLRIFTVDLSSLRLGAELPLEDLYAGPCEPDPRWGEVEPDWVGVSPLGTYLVVQWPGDGSDRCHGMETFDVASGVYRGHVTSSHGHGDLGLLADGTTEVFVTTELSGPPEGVPYAGGSAEGAAIDGTYPALSYRALPGPSKGEQRPAYLYLTDWIIEHISCRGPAGWCLATAATNEANGALDPLEGELFLFRLDGSQVIRLAQHRSSGAGYWQQPRASLSPDGRYVIFDSDWEPGETASAPAVYVIDLAATPP